MVSRTGVTILSKNFWWLRQAQARTIPSLAWKLKTTRWFSSMTGLIGLSTTALSQTSNLGSSQPALIVDAPNASQMAESARREDRPC